MTLNYNEIIKYISASRLQNYEAVCKGDKNRVLKLYQTNLKLSQAYYPLLSLFEVILRNALNEEITKLFSDNNWLINQQTGFMVHSSLTYTDRRTNNIKQNHFLKNSVAKSITDLGAAATHGKIIADLKFGFWTALFDNTHYHILRGRPIKIFSNLPSGCNRNTVNKKLIHIRAFRNRVYHNEPIIFGKDSDGNVIFDLSDAKIIYTEIKELFDWIDIDFEKWTKKINNIEFELARAECMMKFYPSIKYYLNRIFLGIKYYKMKYIKNNG